MGSLFDLTHMIYIVVSLSVTVGLLLLGKRFLKKKPAKEFFLKFFALATFFLHTSVLWVDYLKNGVANVPDNILFPIFFCNMSMYMLLIIAFWRNKRTKLFQIVAIITAYGGFFGAMISLFYPAYYLGASSIFEWGVFKSMLSHSTMLIGSTWLLVSGYVKIRLSNAIVYFGGLLFYGLIGVIVNFTFEAFGLHNPNAMYLEHPPLSEAPFLNAVTIALLMVLIIFLFSSLMEKYTNPDAPKLTWKNILQRLSF